MNTLLRLSALAWLLFAGIAPAHAFVFFSIDPKDGHAIENDSDLNHKPIIWKTDTVVFNVDFQSTKPGANLDYTTSLQSALTTYNNLANIDLNLVMESSTYDCTRKNTNDVIFIGTTYCNKPYAWGDAIGLTLLTRETSSTFPEGRIAETDIYFKKDVNWFIQDGACASSRNVNFNCVTLHEVGHALGLGHPDQAGQPVDAIMISVQTSQLSSNLYSDDKRGVTFLYAGVDLLPSLPLPATQQQDQGVGAMLWLPLLALFMIRRCPRFYT